MNDEFKWLDKIDGNIIFGSGGLGDALLLLSFYLGKINNLCIIFWANNKSLLDTFFSIFQKDIPEQYKIKQKIIFNKHQSKEMFNEILNHKNFCGKGHIPDNFDYKNEWGNNYEKYLSEIQPNFNSILLKIFEPIKLNNKKHIGLHLFGSLEDKWKRKCVTEKEFESIINKFKKEKDFVFYLFGSKEDKLNYSIEHLDSLNNFIDIRGESLETHFKTISAMNQIISVDSWIKTYSSFLNIDTTIIKNEYYDSYVSMEKIGEKRRILSVSNKKVSISKIFPGYNIDPADNIFLNPKFNFKFTTFEEIVESTYILKNV